MILGHLTIRLKQKMGHLSLRFGNFRRSFERILTVPTVFEQDWCHTRNVIAISTQLVSQNMEYVEFLSMVNFSGD